MPLTLGPLERSQLPQFLQWRNSPDLQSHVRHPGLLAMADHEHWFDGLTDNPVTKMWGIYRDGGLCGMGGLCYINPERLSAEISVYVMRPDNTEDYTAEPEAINLLCRKAFETLGLKEVWSVCLTDIRANVFQSAWPTSIPFQCLQLSPGLEYLLTIEEWRDAQ